MTIKRVAGVEPNPSQVQVPPAHDSLPWACATCGGWVSHVERIYTDAGLFHDRIKCLSGDEYEALVARYGCKCTAVEPPCECDYCDIPRVTPEEKREAHRIAVALEPGTYTSDDLDRIVAGRDRP
jgi:hypothetical protein